MQMKGKIGIVGSGIIGSSWATLFCQAGYEVCIYDVGDEQIKLAEKRIYENLMQLKRDGLQRGSLSPSDAFALVRSTTSLAVCLKDAIYVQESTVERVDFRRKVFEELDALAAPHCILASSSSTIPASAFTEHLKNRSNCVIVHPVNPPLLVPLTEIVPAPWTLPEVVTAAFDIMTDIGQTPIRLKREIDGFGVNRLQYALIAESWRLVKDGVLSPEDVDKVIRCGLAHRYAFYGPFEVCHLNAYGIEDYCKRYTDPLRRVLADFGPAPTFDEPEVIEPLKEYLNKRFPLPQLSEHMADRETKLAALANLKNKMKLD